MWRIGSWRNRGEGFPSCCHGFKIRSRKIFQLSATAGNSEHLSRSEAKASKRKVITELKRCSACLDRSAWYLYCKCVEIINASFLCSSGPKSDTMNVS
ncbi:hypothetical protein CDAR_566911 [Caerostris darwini]|uniref:Uncharacterized protein n=1 Tax=Caerostris darwini TaxID=1538125 RepID=A0AAV4PIJ2_9ARAC|nr:hypothetical protein CDAR_566911 [Caerostris darwini]